MMKVKFTTFTLLILSLLASACNGNNLVAQVDLDQPLGVIGLQAWIDAPLNGTSLLLEEAPFDVVVHGNYPDGLTGFELSVNGLPYATSATQNQSEPFTDFTFQWTPQTPGIYLLSVRAMAESSFGLPAQVQVTVNGDVAAEAVEVPELQVEEPPAPSSCSYTALVNLFCRYGPGQVYSEVDSFVPDDVANVIGISPDSSHAQVLGPNFGNACFVPIGERFGQLDGACDDLEVVSIPPTPTPTLTPTPEPVVPTNTPVPPAPQASPTPTCNPANIAGPPCP